MNAKELLEGMGAVDERFIQEADGGEHLYGVPDSGMEKQSRTKRRHWGAAAACIALLLTVTSTAIAGAKNTKIQAWLSEKWAALTGEQLSSVQQHTIESLSLQIGQSVTKEGTTVTLDSYLSGRERSWILVNVTGIPFSEQSRYYFKKWKIKINGKEAGGSGVMSEEVGEDGALQMLYSHGSPSKSNLSLLDPPDLFDTETWEMTLVLDGLFENKGDEQVLVQEGRWKFRFTVPNAKNAVTTPLADTVIQAYQGRDEQEQDKKQTEVALTNICFSETGVSMRYAGDLGYVCKDPMLQERILLPRIELLLRDGRSMEAEIVKETILLDESGKVSGEYGAAWKVPVSLEEIAGIRLGETEIFR